MTPSHAILGESLIHKVIVSKMRQGTYIKKTASLKKAGKSRSYSALSQI